MLLLLNKLPLFPDTLILLLNKQLSLPGLLQLNKLILLMDRPLNKLLPLLPPLPPACLPLPLPLFLLPLPLHPLRLLPLRLPCHPLPYSNVQ